jgi:mono/diheme cytochrome c family protein/nitrate/TMAO reductase-like tetraheme cytochrome c subunit
MIATADMASGTRRRPWIGGRDERVRRIRRVTGAVAFLFIGGVTLLPPASAQVEWDPQSARELYGVRCAVCHGAGGAGDGPVGLALIGKPSNWKVGGGRLKDLSDQEIYELIARGGNAVGKSVAMPAHPDFSEAQLWNLVAYARSLIGGAGVPVGQIAQAPKRASSAEGTIRWGGALDWSIALTIGISAVILACILVSLIVYRGRQTEGGALWLHLLSLGIFPLFLLAVSNFAVLEYAKEERFCGACHLTMKPYIDDMHNAKSTSMAAFHFQHRSAPDTECYSCHANYGVHGTFEAKMTGLRDVYRYVTRTYHLPLKMRVPFENALCLKCHNGAKRYIAHDIHLKLSDFLGAEQIKCAGCHKPAHAIPKPERAGGPGEVV